MLLTKYIKLFILFSVIIILFCISCNSYNNSEFPIGSQSQTDRTFKFDQPYFEFDKIIKGVKITDSIYFSLKNPSAYDHIYYNTTHAWVNEISKNFYKSIEYADSGINFIKNHHLEKQLSGKLIDFYTFKANSLFGLKKFQEAIDVFLIAKQFASKNINGCANQQLNFQMAMILYQQKEFYLSVRYFYESYRYSFFCQPNNDGSYKRQEILDNIGLCFTKIKRYDSASLYYKKALLVTESAKDSLAVDKDNNKMRYFSAKGVIYGNMAKILVAKNNLDSAIGLYKKAILFHRLSGVENEDDQYCKVQLAALYFEQKKWQQMLALLDEIKFAIQKIYKPDVKLDYEKLLYKYYLITKNIPKQLTRFKNYITIRDSLESVENEMIRTDLDKELKDKQQLHEIELLLKDGKVNKLYLMLSTILAVMALLIVGLIYFLFKKSRQNVKNLTRLNLEINKQKIELESSRNQLQLSNKDKDRILNIVAHDLRNPISGVAAILPTIFSEDATEQMNTVQVIEKTLNQSLLLINQLLEKNNSSAFILNKQALDLNELIYISTILFKLKARDKNQEIQTRLPDIHLIAQLDKNKIERVLQNLLSNAIKFSEVNSKIIVELVQQENRFLLSITDFGIGIPSVELKNIFNKLTTWRKNGTANEESFGLGLSICKDIVDAHCGEIWVESEVGKGSTFHILMPL